MSVVGRDKATGVQKFHVNPTSRLGGVGIMVGYLSSLAALFALQRILFDGLSPELIQIWFGLALASVPVFVAGLKEDLTHTVSPIVRLTFTMLSAALVYWGLGIGVFRVDVRLVDAFLSLPTATFFVTLLVVGGCTHAVNIVDGFHGLASGLMIIMLAGLMAMAWLAQDTLVVRLCGLVLLSTLGFFVFNWPSGKIFLGDAGAYLLGFWVVALALLLVNRNLQLSPMAPVVVGIFPLIETLFSMYRRKFVRQHPIDHPDGLHLHTLVYKRLVARPARQLSEKHKNQANAQVAVYFWLPSLFFTLLAVYFRENTNAQLILIVMFLALYWWVYSRLVTFRVPHWLKRPL